WTEVSGRLSSMARARGPRSRDGIRACRRGASGGTMSMGTSFRPARPRGWVIRAVQTFLRFDLARRNRLHLEPGDLAVLRALPQGVGIILVANHADETDFKACLELSRRSGRRFLFL